MARWIQTIIFLLLGFPVFSQIQFKNIKELLSYADKNSTVARQGNIQLALGREDIALIRSSLLPKLNAFGSAEYSPVIASQVIPESIFGGQDGKFRKVQFGMPWNFSSGVELSMPLINLQKWAQLKKVALQSQEISWSNKAKLENLHIQLTQWYYQALMAKEMIRLNEENVSVVYELMRILEERKKSGVLEPADYNRSRNLQLSIETAQSGYEKVLEQSLIMLRSLINLPATVSLELKDSIVLFNWPLTEIEPARVGHRAAYKESVARTEVAEQSLVESKKASFPKLSLSSRYLHSWQMNSRQSVQFDLNTIGLRLDYAIFDGGYHRRQQKKSELLVTSAYIQQQQVESTLIQQQQEWLNNYKVALAKDQILQMQVNTTAENLRIAQLNLKEGVMEFDAFHNIFSEFNRARIEQLQNLSDGIVYHLLINNNIR